MFSKPLPPTHVGSEHSPNYCYWCDSNISDWPKYPCYGNGATEVLELFKSKAGFDGWWDSIDRKTQVEILDELLNLLTSL